MKSNRALWEVCSYECTPERLVIRDRNELGHLSVTNDAEAVVAYLFRAGTLRDGRRLFYYDTDGNLDELLIKDGKFAGFAPGPNPRVTY